MSHQNVKVSRYTAAEEDGGGAVMIIEPEDGSWSLYVSDGHPSLYLRTDVERFDNDGGELNIYRLATELVDDDGRMSGFETTNAEGVRLQPLGEVWEPTKESEPASGAGPGC